MTIVAILGGMKDDTQKDYSGRINEVTDFILGNLSEKLQLEKLASIANYSPFHFQKIFKQVTGESPKQYIIRMRLETAAHLLVLHRFKSVSEIAICGGFSSPAVFARAFKNYFGISAEKLRNIPQKERSVLYKETNKKNILLYSDIYFKNTGKNILQSEKLQIEIKKINKIKGVFVNSKLNETSIQAAFKKVIQLTDTHDLLTKDSRLIGIIYPHQNLYKAMVTVGKDEHVKAPLLSMEIDAGKYFSLNMHGKLKNTFYMLNTVTQCWLPNSGYRIAEVFGFEILNGNPLLKLYDKIERQILVRLEPA